MISLDVEGFMRVRAAHVATDPNGGLVIIGGNNAQGKSSVIEAIIAALGGNRGLPERPVNDEADKAHIRIELDELIVEKTISRNAAPVLKVTARQGGRIQKPQQLLDTLIGKLSFDPLEFANGNPKTQVDMLLGVINLGIDLDEWAAKRQSLYDARTEVGREKKRLDGVLATLPMVPANAPTEEVDVSALVQQLLVRQRADNRLEELRLLVDDLQSRLSAAMDEARSIATWRSEQPTVGALQQQVSTIRETNQLVRAAGERRKVSEDWHNADAMYQHQSDLLATLDKQKADALARANMPHPALSMSEDGVLMNGRPFSQASSAERLQASVAVAAAANPNLRLILIREGSLLDGEAMDTLAGFAAGANFDLLIERVGAGDSSAVIIEDGYSTS